MDKKIFIGPKEVRDVQTLDEKHRDTIEMVNVIYSDGTEDMMTLREFGALKSDQEQDLTSLRNHLYDSVTKDVIYVLVSYGVKIEDIQFFIATLTQSINNSLTIASSQLWGKEKHLVNLIDVEKVLKTHMKLEDILPRKTT